MKELHLTLDQRYEIQHQKEAGKSQTQIASLIGKHKSVVCRENKYLTLTMNRLSKTYSTKSINDQEKNSNTTTLNTAFTLTYIKSCIGELNLRCYL